MFETELESLQGNIAGLRKLFSLKIFCHFFLLFKWEHIFQYHSGDAVKYSSGDVQDVIQLRCHHGAILAVVMVVVVAVVVVVVVGGDGGICMQL